MSRVVEETVTRVLEPQLAEIEQRAVHRHEELLREMTAWERRQRRDVTTAMEQEAARSSAVLVQREMPAVSRHRHPHATLLDALSHAPDTGLVLEFGVATGTTLRLLAEHRAGRPIFGFDSFEGLPERWRLGYDAGTFATDALPDVPGADLVVGWFADVLPDFLAEHPGLVALLHVDCDLYSSTRTVLQQVGPRLAVGSVVVFDEYYNYPGWEEHEHRAWHEYATSAGLSFDYLGITMDDEQVSVRVTGLARTRGA
ncbi:MAG: class I SAM-dependent methyltransferase [Mycobacteriales bacterium]